MQERRVGELQLRDRLTTLEVKFDNHARHMSQFVEEQKTANDKLDEIMLRLAEQSGAAKAVKVIYGIVVAIIGCIGGMLGALVRHT